MNAKFDEEWWWVFSYGITVVVVVVSNILVLISVLRNAFLHTNANRCFFILALRNVLRAVNSLVVLYSTRWKIFNADSNSASKFQRRNGFEDDFGESFIHSSLRGHRNHNLKDCLLG